MKAIKLITVFLFALGFGMSSSVHAEYIDGLDEQMNAKFARLKAKIRHIRATEAGAGGTERKTNKEVNEKCGSIEIGNTQSRGQAPREVTVIVTGDVVNVGNKCK